MLNIKEDILKNAGNHTVDGPHLLPYSIYMKSMGTNNCLVLKFKISSFVFEHKKETHTGLERHKGE